MITFKDLPLYEAVLGDEEGIMRISLVHDPAVESYWETFDKIDEPEYYKVEDEEQRIVSGCFLRANYPILRKRGDDYFYLTFSKEVIKAMVMKWLSDNRQNEINTDHKKDTEVEGIHIQEVYFKDKDKGIDPKGFENISDGSAFATYKVEDDTVWEKIKDGTWQGFSIEVFADMVPVREDMSEEKLMDDIIEILYKLKNQK